MNRGEVRWYHFRPPDKRRPVLILTRDSAISYLNSITIAPITSQIRNIPTEILLTPAGDGVVLNSVVNLDNIQSVPKNKLGALITILSPERMVEVALALCFALGIDPAQLERLS